VKVKISYYGKRNTKNRNGKIIRIEKKTRHFLTLKSLEMKMLGLSGTMEAKQLSYDIYLTNQYCGCKKTE